MDGHTRFKRLQPHHVGCMLKVKDTTKRCKYDLCCVTQIATFLPGDMHAGMRQRLQQRGEYAEVAWVQLSADGAQQCSWIRTDGTSRREFEVIEPAQHSVSQYSRTAIAKQR